MSRYCLRCEMPMLDNGFLSAADGSYIHIKLKKQGKRIKKNLGIPKVAVCPKCGEVSIYLPDPSVITADTYD